MDMAAEKGCGYPGRRYGGSDYRALAEVMVTNKRVEMSE